MGSGWSEEKFADYKLQLHTKNNCLTAWELIELLGMGYFSHGMNSQILSMGITEVFQELILDVLKQVRPDIYEEYCVHSQPITSRVRFRASR